MAEMRRPATHFHIVAAPVGQGFVPLTLILGGAAGHEEQESDEYAQTQHGVSPLLGNRIVVWFRRAIPNAHRRRNREKDINGLEQKVGVSASKIPSQADPTRDSVEARGIEPRSRSTSTCASTCVVDRCL